MQSITHLTDALYQAQLSKLQDVLTAEHSLRRALADLEIGQKDVSQMDSPGFGQMRQIGADIIWQGWVDRKRRDLQAELARCLVQKNRLMRHVQKAFGRKSAADQIQADARSEAMAARTMRHALEDQNLMLLKAADTR